MAIGTPVVVGTATSTTSSTSLVITLSSGVTAGDKAFVWTGVRTGIALVSGIVDSKGNTWVVDQTFTDSNAGNAMGIASCQVTSSLAASDTVTITYAATAGPSKQGFVFSVSGLDTGSAFDKTANHMDDLTGGATTFTSGSSGVLSQADEIVFGCFEFFTVATSLVPNAGFVELQYLSTSGAASSDRAIWLIYQIVSATTALNPGGSQAVAVQLSGGITATYKAAAAAPSTTGLINYPRRGGTFYE